jgi:phosphodiesterase/alkaline phosphatase D-like protein
MAQLRLDGGTPRERFWNDAWDGYPAARKRLLQAMQAGGQGNAIVLGGDWHSTFVNDLKLDFDAASAPVVPPNSSPRRSAVAATTRRTGRTTGRRFRRTRISAISTVTAVAGGSCS